MVLQRKKNGLCSFQFDDPGWFSQQARVLWRDEIVKKNEKNEKNIISISLR